MFIRIFSVDDTEVKYEEDAPTLADGLTPIRSPSFVQGTRLLWEGELGHVPAVDDSIAVLGQDVTVVARVFYLPSDSEEAFVALYVEGSDTD